MKTSEQRVEIYNQYFNQSEENLNTIKELIRLKNLAFTNNLIPRI